MLWWIALYAYILYRRYSKAKEQGIAQEWRTKLICRYLWILTGLLLLYSIVIGYASKTFSAEHMCLKWEAVLLAFLGIMVSPLFLKGMWRVSRIAAIFMPIICAMATVFYIPFSTGSNVTETVTLIGIGVISIFAVGVVTVFLAIVAVILVMMLIGFLSIPVVYVI